METCCPCQALAIASAQFRFGLIGDAEIHYYKKVDLGQIEFTRSSSENLCAKLETGHWWRRGSVISLWDVVVSQPIVPPQERDLGFEKLMSLVQELACALILRCF